MALRGYTTHKFDAMVCRKEMKKVKTDRRTEIIKALHQGETAAYEKLSSSA